MNGTEKNERIQLTEDSHCVVHSLGDRNTMLISRGFFRGYSSVGGGDALCMELDDSHEDLKGKIRLIPSYVVLAVDLIEIAEGDAEEEEQHPTGYYG